MGLNREIVGALLANPMRLWDFSETTEGTEEGDVWRWEPRMDANKFSFGRLVFPLRLCVKNLTFVFQFSSAAPCLCVSF